MFRFFLAFTLILLSFNAAAFGSSADIKLTPQNTLTLRGEVNEESVADLSKQILNSKSDKIYLYLDSPGGSIYQGLLLIDVMKGSGKDFECIAGYAASMAFVILQYCDERYVMHHSILMQHVYSFGLDQAPAHQQFELIKFFEQQNLNLETYQADRLGIPLDEFRAKVRNDWYLDSSAALAYNAADKLVTVECSKELLAMKVTKIVRGFFGDSKVEYSACPLLEQATTSAVP